MAVESIDPSLNERPDLSRGAYPIPLSKVTTAGFLGRADRGPVNEPVCIESYPEYARYFGGRLVGDALAQAVQDFFLQGGRRAVIVRVVNRARRARIDVPANGDVLRLQARYPGRFENLRISIDYEQAADDPCLFNLVVQRLSTGESRLVEDQELYPLISTRRSDSRFIGDVLKDSRLIALSGPAPRVRPDAMPPNRPGESMRYVELTEPGDDGDELTDYDIIGSDRDGTGVFSFSRGPRIDLLAIPQSPERELGTTAFVAASRYCEQRRALMIWDPPWSWQTADAAILGARRLDYANGNVITYFPRIRPRGSQLRFAGGLPACGVIAGMLARRDRRGIWGGHDDEDFLLRAALTPALELSPGEAKGLIRYGINAFVHGDGGMARLTGGVTLGAAGFGPSFSLNLHRRRLGLFILAAIEEAAAPAVVQHDKQSAVLRCESQLRRFFDDLYRHGALRGTTPGQAYYVHMRRSSKSDVPGLRFGFALNEPGRFAEYVIDLAGEAAGTVHRVAALDGEQLFS